VQIEGFDLEGELGRGGMGVVHRARQRSTGRVVALKVISAHLARGETHRERFRREGEVMAALRHPGIVAVHSAGFEADVPWLACELVEGARTLDEATRGAPLRRKVELARDLARALGHAHAAGVVHRDVKPHNALVDRAGHLRVTDFGLALAEEQERLTRTGQLVGTPFYMSPEQLRGERVGPPSDVWAVGVVLFELACGRLPFEAETLAELGRLHAQGARPPSEHAREVPAALDAVVLAALAVDPDQRPADGEALARELDEWLAGREPLAALGERGRARRRLLRAGALLVGALGAVAVAGPLHRAWVEGRARAQLDEALAWDEATLARWSFGAGEGEAPERTELFLRATRLAVLEASLDPGPLRQEVASARARVAAHERLVARRREPVALDAGEADRVVDALLAVEERQPDAPGVDLALRRAAGDAPAAIARAWGRAIERGLAVSAEGVAAALAAAPPAERAALIQRAGPWSLPRASEAQARLLLHGASGALRELPGWVALAGATGQLEVLERERAGPLASWRYAIGAAPTPRGARSLGKEGWQAASALWRGLRDDPALERDLPPALVEAFGDRRADGRVLLRALRMAARASILYDSIGEPPTLEAIRRALRFDAAAARLDEPGYLPLTSASTAALKGVVTTVELLAEYDVALLRWDEETFASARGRPEGERRAPGTAEARLAALRAIAAERPWSNAALAAVVLEEARVGDLVGGDLVERGLAALDAPCEDLAPRGGTTLVQLLAGVLADLPPSDPRARSGLDGLWRIVDQRGLERAVPPLLVATAAAAVRAAPQVDPVAALDARLRGLVGLELSRGGDEVAHALERLGRARATTDPALAERLLRRSLGLARRSFELPSAHLVLADIRLQCFDPAGAARALAVADQDDRRHDLSSVELAASLDLRLHGPERALARIDEALRANREQRDALQALRERYAPAGR
jgi:hypothetical protein